MSSPSLTPETTAYIDGVSLEKRKQLGQYMTPSDVSDLIFDHITLTDDMKVLDPAVGTGELLLAVKKRLTDQKVHLTGWEVDEAILQVAQKQLPEATMEIRSMLDGYPSELEGTFDFIIGNPPYFELKNTDYDRNSFSTAEGRTNIYGLFFERCIPLLKEGGRLAFIVPPSMNAGAYFKKLRSFITENTVVEHIEIVRDNKKFVDALTSVQIIVLRKETNPAVSSFVQDFSELTGSKNTPVIFTDDKAHIESAWVGKKSIHDYGYEVVTGNVVWNQNKDNLSESKTEASTVLYYAKDIDSGNVLLLSAAVNSRRWLVSGQPALQGSTILVNRIVGSLDNPRIKAALVTGDKYYAENHVNVIQPRKGVKVSLSIEELFTRLTSIPDLTTYLKAVTGNTQLSAKEVEWLLPL